MQRRTNIQLGELVKIPKLSSLLGLPIVIFDIEHTGYKAEGGITEFGGLVIGESGEVARFNSLINPGDVNFNPMSMKISRISKKMLSKAPSYLDSLGGFVNKYQNGVWVGFNSNSSDLPFLIKEHLRFGFGDWSPALKLDVMTFSTSVLKLKGSLSSRFATLPNSNPDADTAHVALSDAIMTAALLEECLKHATFGDLRSFGIPV